MSSVVPQTESQAAVASAKRSAASSLSNSPVNSLSKDVVEAPPKLQCPPPATANGSRGRWFALRCAVDAVHDVVAPRFVTTLVIAGALIGLMALAL